MQRVVEGDPHLAVILNRLENDVDFLKRENERKDREIESLQEDNQRLERWRKRIDTHHGYTQESINRARDKGEGLRDQVHTGEIKRTEINVKLLILLGILATIGSALLGAGISHLLK